MFILKVILIMRLKTLEVNKAIRSHDHDHTDIP